MVSGFGFITFEEEESVNKAVAEHYVDVNGKKVLLIVKLVFKLFVCFLRTGIGNAFVCFILERKFIRGTAQGLHSFKKGLIVQLFKHKFNDHRFNQLCFVF